MIDVRPFCDQLGGKGVYVYGLGLSGRAALEAFAALGDVYVYAYDDKGGGAERANALGARWKAAVEAPWDKIGALILSPGIPLYYPTPHPVVAAARAADVLVMGDMDVFAACKPADLHVIAITGTNGKSTTSALTAHILKAAGKRAVLGGNIGAPVLGLDLEGAEIAVLELSSYQIDLAPHFNADTAVLLNITPDHLDRHGSFDNYVAAKEALLTHARRVVCAQDDAATAAVLDRQRDKDHERVLPIATQEKAAGGVYAEKGVLIDDLDGEGRTVAQLAAFKTLPGRHNAQNIAAAYAACRLSGLEAAEIVEAAESFSGLSHRQFRVRVINGVAYINDSKATNADSAATALATFDKIYWIAGGRPKEGGLDGLENHAGRIRKAYLIGEAEADFARWCDRQGIEYLRCGTLPAALAAAHEDAQSQRGQPGGAGTVLLSPACASWDQFPSFEARGALFEELVNALPEAGTEEAAG